MNASRSAARSLAEVASMLTGVNRDAIHPRALARSFAGLPMDAAHVADLVHRALAGDGLVRQRLEDAASVPETYFYRHPEQIRRVHAFAADEIANGRRCLRAWSAGCATGEEAYSVAASLLAAARAFRNAAVDVLGTDLVQRHIEVARGARYRAWSVRPSGPELYPLLGEGTLAVRPEVRAAVRFQRHNLMDPLGEGGFDIVLCRNVLVYLRDDAKARVLLHLVEALAPGGLLVLGPLDVESAPAGTMRYQAAEHGFFRRASSAPPSSDCVATVDDVPDVPSGVRPKSPDVADATEPQLEALAMLERGDLTGAARVLRAVVRRAPDSIPAVMQLGMIERHLGDGIRARRYFQEVLRLASALDGASIVAGPQPLPARFYATAAREFLDRRDE